jgi:lipopolysaccharide transport system permease protein
LSTSTTFTANAHLFGKVYFPRLVTPVSTVISALLQFVIQLLPLLAAMSYYGIFTDTTLHLGPRLLLIIPLLILSALMSLGAGILLASLTTKYRDLSVFLNFGILLLMYISAVVYPVSQVPELYRPFVKYNPVVPLIEGFRYAMIGAGSLKPEDLIYASIVALLLFIAGVIIFNRTERTFMDTV